MKSKTGKKSVTKQTKKNASKRDRAKYRCPEPVKEIIALINSIPPDRKMPHRREILEKTGNDGRKAIEIIKGLLQGVPQSFIDQNGGPYRAYVEFRNLRRAVRSLANLACVPEDARDSFLSVERYFRFYEYPDDRRPDRILDEDADLNFDRIPDPKLRDPKLKLYDWDDHSEYDFDSSIGNIGIPGFYVSMSIGPEGRTKAVAKGLAQILLELDYDATRLRVCEVCLQIFWARQDNMYACSTQCSNTRRQRELRKKRREYKTVQRRKKRRK